MRDVQHGTPYDMIHRIVVIRAALLIAAEELFPLNADVTYSSYSERSEY